jgi:hypothetical protein
MNKNEPIEPERPAVSGAVTGSAALDVIAASNRELDRMAGAEPVRREVVKLVTSSWHDKRGLHIRRDLLSVKRKSSGHQCLEEDCSMISPDEVWPRIVNLHECKDGLYEVVICNEWKDWETGYVEDYDYRLVAFGGGLEISVCGTMEKQPNKQITKSPELSA